MLKRMSAKIPPNPPLKKGGARSAGGFSHAGLPVALLAALTLAGCAVGPDYQRPALELPSAWPELGAAGAPPAQPADRAGER